MIELRSPDRVRSRHLRKILLPNAFPDRPERYLATYHHYSLVLRTRDLKWLSKRNIRVGNKKGKILFKENVRTIVPHSNCWETYSEHSWFRFPFWWPFWVWSPWKSIVLVTGSKVPPKKWFGTTIHYHEVSSNKCGVDWSIWALKMEQWKLAPVQKNLCT